MRRSFFVIFAFLSTAACTPVDLGFGESVRWSNAQQVIDPDPQHDRTLTEGGSGERSARAVDRYNRGEVIEPVVETTTSAQSGSGSGPN